MDSKMQHVTSVIPATLAIGTPAIRMVVIEAWAWNQNKTWCATHNIKPVIAIMARQGHRFQKRWLSEFPRTHATPAAMEKDGWVHEEAAMEIEVVVCDDEFGLCTESDLRDTDNVVTKVVPCTWPPEEDESRLSEIIRECERKAVSNAMAMQGSNS